MREPSAGKRAHMRLSVSAHNGRRESLRALIVTAIYVGRVNIRSIPSDEYRTHPFTKRKRDAIEHKSAFREIISELGKRVNSGGHPLPLGEIFAAYSSDMPRRDGPDLEIISYHSGREVSVLPLSEELSVAFDIADQWVAMPVAEGVEPESVRSQVQAILEDIADALGIAKDVDVCVDLVTSPQKVYDEIIALQAAGLKELTLTVQRPNTGMSLKHIQEQWIEAKKARKAKIELRNDDGELDIPRQEVKELSSGAGRGDLTIAARSADGSHFDSADHPWTFSPSAEMPRRIVLLGGLATWVEEYRKRKGGS